MSIAKRVVTGSLVITVSALGAISNPSIAKAAFGFTQVWQSTITDTPWDSVTGDDVHTCNNRHGSSAFPRSDAKGKHCWKRMWRGF